MAQEIGSLQPERVAEHPHGHATQQAVEMQSDADLREYRAFQRFKLLANDMARVPMAAGHVGGSSAYASTSPVPAHLENAGFEAADAHRGPGYLGQQFPTIANPAPIGLCGFALTTFVLSMHNAGAGVNTTGPNGVVLGLALFYGGIVQFAAGMWEVRTGNTFGAVAFASYGGFWMSYAALFVSAFGFLDGYASASPADLRHSLGIYLLGWTIFTFIMLVASHRTTVGLFALFFVLTLTFLLLTIGNWIDSVNCIQAGGVLGIIDAFIAWYCAIAALLTPSNSVFRLPIGELAPMWEKRGYGREAHASAHGNGAPLVSKNINGTMPTAR